MIDDDFFESASRIETTQDITESGAYSLQEVKIKSETDRETEEAEKKKQVSGRNDFSTNQLINCRLRGTTFKSFARNTWLYVQKAKNMQHRRNLRSLYYL